MQKTEEREVKFHIEPDAATPDLTRLPDGLRIVERPEVRLSARYFDTAGLDLLRRGITLRHRRDLAGDGEDLWTLKLPDALQQTVLSRTEVSWPGDNDDVPDEARRILTAVLHDDLLAVAAFVTVRQRREVHDGDGRRLAEIDDDRVTVTAPTAKVFRQIEVELDAGDAHLIARLSKLLRRSGASRSDNSPKLRIVLADQIDEAAAEPTPDPQAMGSTLGELLRQRIGESLDKLITHDIALRLNEHHEGVHQARVACRRLRSDLKTFGPLVDRDWLVRTSAELRWIGNVLGAVRDLDVLERRIAGHAGAHPDADDADGFAAIGVRIASQRSSAWKQVHAALDSDRYQQLLVDLTAATLDPPRPEAASPGPAPEDAAAAGVGELVRGPWRRMRQTVRRLPAQPSDADLHRVRIRAKQLRYAAESATPVIGADARRLARAAEQVQTELGDHHDAVVAEEALRRLVPTLKRQGAFVAGQCVAAERREQSLRRASWPEAWEALDDPHLRRWLTH